MVGPPLQQGSRQRQVVDGAPVLEEQEVEGFSAVDVVRDGEQERAQDTAQHRRAQHPVPHPSEAASPQTERTGDEP